MEIHVHLFAEKAKIFDQYSLIIVHWRNDKREKERAKEEDERENKLEEAEAKYKRYFLSFLFFIKGKR